MEKATNNKGKLRVYACGGGGVNIGYLLEKYRGLKEPGFAELDVVYIDTSRSNIKAEIKEENIYLIPDVDGSGKIRAENHLAIAGCARNILQQFKPGDLNVVLSTAAGGSGSVIAPLLASELLAADAPLIAIAIGSTDTTLEAENTYKTLLSYESISKIRSAPIVLYYEQNNEKLNRVGVNNSISLFITKLTMLASRENAELDTRDIRNWLRFDVPTSFGPQLASLAFIEKQDIPKELGNLISVATLATEEANIRIGPPLEYQCNGHVPSSIDPVMHNTMPIHFIVCDGPVKQTFTELKALVKEIEQGRAARKQRAEVLTPEHKPTDTGLML
jgi:hypothetical protein